MELHLCDNLVPNWRENLTEASKKVTKVRKLLKYLNGPYLN